MNDQVPSVCEECRAFLVRGRPDCPFCGTVPPVAPAADPPVADPPDTSIGAPHGEHASAPADRAWLPTVPAALADSGGSGIDGGWLLRGAGVLAVITLVAVLFIGVGRSRRSSDASASGSGPIERLAGVCDGVSQPIAGATAFRPEPGPHRVEAIVIPPADGSIGRRPSRLALGLKDGWNAPPASELKTAGAVEAVELVGCYVVTRATEVRTCGYGTPGTGSEFSLALWSTSGRIVVREARTGDEVFRTDVPAEPGPACPVGGTRADERIVAHPEGAIRSALRVVNDGTDPSLPIAEQVAGVCSQDLFRAAVPASRPVDAVTVAVRTSEDGPFEALGPTGPVVTPAELLTVGPDQAGTVLCVTAIPGTAPSVRPVTLATGATNFGRTPAGATVVDGQGRTVLPWEAPSDSGIRPALAAPRA